MFIDSDLVGFCLAIVSCIRGINRRLNLLLAGLALDARNLAHVVDTVSGKRVVK